MTDPIHSTAPEDLSGAYRAVWRWHFYAGVFVMPFLMLLALTGAIYLFKDEIDQAVYRPMIRVADAPGVVSPDAWLPVAAKAGQGRVANVLIPRRGDEAARVRVDRPDGSQRTVFVDPHTGRVTGVTAYGGVMETVKTIHSLSLFGSAMNLMVEVAAGWAIVLFATGIYLWWPRRRRVATVTLTATDIRRRPFWRDLHALVGLYVGGIVLFLAVTGMPWSAVWGDQVLGFVRAQGWGRPPAPAAAKVWSHAGHHDSPSGVGWTMEHAVLYGRTAHDPSLARVMAVADGQGLARPYVVNVPKSPNLAWTVARVTRQAEDARTLYIDGQTGAVLADARWAQFGLGAKAFEWGIAVHQGLQYGPLNRLVMLAGCIGVWLLAISGLMMWWKRRPPRLSSPRLGAPPAPPGARIRTAVLGIVLPLCILYPLTGLSLLAALLIDRIGQALLRRRTVPS
ncbi:PepSY domain-containing protein [Brevundimonas sp. SORGH_AS_0993]|uniref:PepSY-associated TM helix domain-containing protein n=1 Tax=Brevundimonas sp. SORGH_AS_0993 TaxID=3041794 RepID=UPI002786462E|nr:PepSY domain-containing protein [Brevundimonas sp. SORGH_AS_0993]MDQ1152931.1 putative iron-regulated membrane protein [Brevundimonas sp. SORGH_AS_0993]